MYSINYFALFQEKAMSEISIILQSANRAFDLAYKQALSQGNSVLVVKQSVIIEIFPDCSEKK